MSFKDTSITMRFFVVSACLLVLLAAWRFFSPYSVPARLDKIGDDVRGLWSVPYFHLGELAVTPTALLKASLFVLLLALLTRIIRRIVRARILEYTPLDEGQKFALEKGLQYLVFAIGLIIGLQSAGVNMSSFAVVGGAIGIGVGFGLQTIVKDFVSGLVLLLERPIKVGDRVEVGTLQGDVVQIGARGTWVRTNDNVVMIVPNSEFVENRVTNWTANDRQVRITIPVGVSYSSDPGEVRQILLDVARGHPDVLETPKPDVIFIGFGDSSLDFELRIWTTKQVQTPKIISSDFYFSIFQAFAERGIEIPFPQRDLHVRSVEVPIPISANSGERHELEAPRERSQ